MKSTKNVLMAGVALAIALFSSVQVSANLTRSQRNEVNELYVSKRNEYSEPNLSPGLKSVINEQIKACVELMNTTKSYTDDEFERAMNRIRSMWRYDMWRNQ